MVGMATSRAGIATSGAAEVEPVDVIHISAESGDLTESIQLSARILDFKPRHFETIGRIVAESLKRKQAQLICDRDGHDFPPILEKPVICARCSLYMSNLPDAHH